ncbi:MAG: AMP-binding protein [Chitinophagales bacterium]|nr:AMP-binding protein [Chitinophagales bacterium]
MKNNITQHFFEAAHKYPDKTAIISNNGQISFAELERAVRQRAALYRARGLGEGDRVLIFVPMSIELYASVLALFSIGATAVFLDEWVSLKRMEACCEVAQCKGLIGNWKARILSWISGPLRKIPIKLRPDARSHELAEVPLLLPPDSTALITFTTGSTGTPKAAKRTHQFLQEQFSALIQEIDPHPDDVDMPALPIVLLINLGAGCTSLIADFKASKPESIQADKICQQLLEYKVNRMVGSPFFVRKIAEHLLANHIQIPDLQKVFTGGAPVFPAEAALYVKAFEKAKIHIVYGSTEAEPISKIDGKILAEENLIIKNKSLSGLPVGQPAAVATVRIIGITDAPLTCTDAAALDHLCLPEAEIGEIIVSGPHVLRAYFNNEEALLRNKIFVGDTCWHRSGDSGYLLEGRLYLTGRCNTLIYREGRILSPFVYENLLQNLEGVRIGTLLERRGALLAVLETEAQADKQALQAYICKAEPLIERVVFTDKIPRDPRHNSKIDYPLLRLKV